MKILLVTTSYPDTNAGEAAAGNFVVDFARSLVECGATTTVVAPAATARNAIDSGVDVRRFRVPRLPLSLISPTRPSDWLWILQTLTAGRRAVDHAAAETRPDHILALWVLPSGWWAMRAASRQNVPFSTWALGSDIWTLGKIPLVSQVLSHVLRRAHSRFADGLQLCRDVEALSGMPCGFLPSSRDLKPLIGKSLRDRPPYRFAYLGRWHPNKGTDLLLQALGILNDEDWAQIEAVQICGGGPLEGMVRADAERLASSGRPVMVGGYLDQNDARNLLAWADYLLIPSRIESIPVVFSDAMQMACPVIATPVGDLQALVDNHRCGVCSRAVEPQSFAEALRKAIRTAPSMFASGVAHARSTFEPRQAATAWLGNIETVQMSSASSQPPPAASDPLWGDRDRQLKAFSILATCRRVIGGDFTSMRWLDIGCGCGDIAAAIAPHVGHITGIDPSPWQRWPELRALHPNLDLIQGDFRETEKVNPPDVIVCNQVYEHVEQPWQLVRFMHRILKPGGHVYFAGPNLLFPIEPHVFWPFVHWLPRKAAVKIMRALQAPYVVTAHSVTLWKLLRWFQGFEVINALPLILRHPNDHGRKGLPWKVLSKMPGDALAVLTAFSPGFIFILRKPPDPAQLQTLQ